MVGYTTNGYRIWNPRKKTLFTSRDVVFDEISKRNEQVQPVTRLGGESDVEEVPIRVENPVALEPDDDGSAEEEEIVDDRDDESADDDAAAVEEDAVNEPGPSTSGKKLNVAELTEDEDEEPTGALPSQPERDNCQAEVSTRHSGRERRIPGKFLDFITGFGGNTAGGCFTDSIEGNDVMAYALNAEAFVENLPSTISGLKKRSDWNHWKSAIESEMDSLCKNETWELVPKPPKKNIIDCKWVFKVKRDEAGNVDRYKARLVAKGYSQRRGFDYDETYAPVAKITTVALSSTEAEYVSLSQAICEAVWLRNLLIEFGATMDQPVQMFEDNQSCIRIAEEPREHKRMKHVDIRYNFIREKIQEGLFKINYIRTED